MEQPEAGTQEAGGGDVTEQDTVTGPIVTIIIRMKSKPIINITLP